MRVFLSYSIYTNGSELMSVSAHKQGTLKSLASIRFLSMTWVVAGHVLGNDATSDALMPVMEMFNPFLSTTLTNAFFSVDTFFLLSGILVSYLFFKNRPTTAYVKSPFSWIMFYVHRYLRLTPPIMVFIWLYVNLDPLVNGPWAMSAINMFQAADPCKKYWWRNLLYINNFFGLDEGCYIITWYLAVDTQLYFVAPVFLVALFISPIAGIALIVLCIAASIGYVYYLTITYDFPATMMGGLTIDANLMSRMMDFFTKYYQKPWCRCSPYLVGIAVGYILALRKKPKLNKIFVVSLWVLSAAVALACLYGPHRYIEGTDIWSSAVSGTYNNFSRFGWSLAVSWVIIANHLGWGGIIADFMDHPMWQPLGKLSYCGYIVHMFLIRYIYDLDDRPSHFVSMWRTYIYACIPAVVVSYVFGFIWSCLFEVPVVKIEKMLTANLLPNKRSSARPIQMVEESPGRLQETSKIIS